MLVSFIFILWHVGSFLSKNIAIRDVGAMGACQTRELNNVCACSWFSWKITEDFFVLSYYNKSIHLDFVRTEIAGYFFLQEFERVVNRISTENYGLGSIIRIFPMEGGIGYV